MKISISDRAHSNIENIAEFTLDISIDYANRVIADIYSTIELIKDSPYIGRYLPELNDKHYRERICGKYRIIYVVSEKSDTIYIRYIISGKQDTHSFFKIHKKELFNFLTQLLS